MKTTKENKWLLVSCLQKSIRNGFADLALFYAKELCDIDKEYLYRKLALILVEDIGVANIELVSRFLKTKADKNSIDELGGVDFISKIIKEMCDSVKDRSAADLVYLSTFYQDSMPDETKEKEKIFIDDNEPIVNRLLAGWEILGSGKMKNTLVFNKTDDVSRFISLNKRIIKDDKVLSIIENSYHIQKEPHFVALGLLAYIFQKEKEKTTKVGNFLPGDFVFKTCDKTLINNKWLLSGIDWNTKEGRSAIIEFCDINNETIKFLKSLDIKKELLPETIGMLLFRVRGHLVNKRVVYPSAVVIMKMTEKMTFQKITNQNSVHYAKAIELFEQDLQMLDEIIMKKMSVPNPTLFPF